MPASKKKLPTEKGESSRARILETALDLFAHRGYHNTSVSLIAKETGVSKGLIFNYFKNKEDLLMGILNMGMEKLDGVVGEFQQITDPHERLRFMLEASFQSMQEDLEQYKLMTALSLQLDEFPAITEIVKGKYKSMLQMITQLLSEIGIDDPTEGYVLGTILDGIGFQYIALGDAAPLEEVKNYLIKKYKLDT